MNSRTEASPPDFTIVVFCAEWCGACRSYRLVLQRLLATRPDVDMVWLDIENDAALTNEIDIEDFPTAALFRAGTPLYFGTILPQEHVVAQLLRAIATASAPLSDIPEALFDLYAQLPLTAPR